MKKILLTKGLYAKVDDENYDWLNQWKWYSRKGRSGEYASRLYNKKNISMHRLILNAPSSLLVDHINRDTLDNRKSNLRVCTHSQNAMNTKFSSRNTSGYKGVYWYKDHKRWRSRIRMNGKDIVLGDFKVLEEAAKASKDAYIKYHGKFSSINSII